jgi:zinc protease
MRRLLLRRPVADHRLPGTGIALLLAVAFVAGLRAQAPEVALDRVLPVDAAVRTGRLPNGLQYFIRPNGRPEKRVALRLAVNAGSLQEENDQRGLAHLIEHMAFNGTEHFKPGELVSFLESIGARFGPHVNAVTSFDETVYMLEVPTDREGYLDTGLLALADFAAGLSLLPAEVEKERGVVLEEWRGRLGAGSRITDRQLPVLLQGSRYAERLPIGLPDVIAKAPRERLEAFYRKWYRPDLMAVVVVGDVQPDDVERMIRERFGAIRRPADPVATVDRTVPRHGQTLVGMVTDPEAQGWSVELVYKATAEEDQTVRGYRKALVRQLVSEMLNLRLREIARRPTAPFLNARAGSSSLGRVLEAFELQASVPEGRTTEGLAALATEARRVRQFGFSAAELDRARRALLAAYERAYNERGTTESGSYAAEYVRHFLEAEPIPGIELEFKIAATYLPQVTAEEASGLARTLISEDNRVVLGVAPEKKETPAPTEEALRAALARANAAPVEPWADVTAGRELVEKAPRPGRVVGRREIAEIGVTVLTLANGVEVWLKPTDFKHDQVLFSAYAPGGLSLASPADYKSAALATAIVGVGGLGGLSPVDLSKLLSGRIAQASPTMGAYTHGVSGSSTPRDLETALQLTYLAFTAPNFTPEAFDLLKRRLAGALENREQNPRAVFSDRTSLVNTSNHYSAMPLRASDLASLTLETTRAFYHARFANAADFTFFFVGTFSVSDLTPLIEQWLGGLPSTLQRASAFKDMGVRFPSAPVREEVRKGKEPASQTLVSFFADPGLDEFEMHRARAAATLLGIRLRDILREELGGTYGVSVAFNNDLPLSGYGMMSIQFGSAPDNVDKLLTATLVEIARLKAQGPSAEDIEKVKELERRDLETNARQNAYWLGSLQTVYMLGWDPVGITRRPQRTERLTPEALHETFKRYFPMDRYTVVTLKPE